MSVDSFTFIPSANILQVSMVGMRWPDSRVTIPVRPTPETSASFFCESPAFSLASLKIEPSVEEKCCGEDSTPRHYDLKKGLGMSVLGHLSCNP
jgi:hypothetical protein